MVAVPSRLITMDEFLDLSDLADSLKTNAEGMRRCGRPHLAELLSAGVERIEGYQAQHSGQFQLSGLTAEQIEQLADAES